MSPIVESMVTFIADVGVASHYAAHGAPTVLPGLAIDQGTLLIDIELLTWPGDILHEAAHIALTPPQRRPLLGGRLAITPAEEMAALAWSYAAAVAAGIDPSLVFHDGGYPMGGAGLHAAFASSDASSAPGVPMLRWYGMTDAYPTMTHWLRPADAQQSTPQQSQGPEEPITTRHPLTDGT
jgi:hypothetical protein